MSVLWCSDLHLKPYTLFRKKRLVGDSAYALSQLVAVALQRGVAAVILGGDVYDSPRPDAYSLKALNMAVQALHAGGVQVYSLEGNHDMTTPIPGLDPVELCEVHDVTPIGGKLSELDGMAFYGFQYCPISQAAAKMALVPECDWLCMHHRFQHMLAFEEAYHYTLDDIPDHIRRGVLCGDVHTADRREYGRNRWFVSTGSTYPTRHGEQRDHTVAILPNAGDPELVKLDYRRTFDMTDQLLCVDDVRDLVAGRHLPPVIITRDEALMEQCGDMAIFVKAYGAETLTKTAEEDNTAVMTLQAAVDDHCGDDAEVKAFLTELLETKAPAQYVEEFIAR